MSQQSNSPPADFGVTSLSIATANSIVGGYDVIDDMMDDMMDNMADDLFEKFIEEDERLDRIGAGLAARLLPHATPAQRRQILEQREQARAAREELRRGVARSRELTRKVRRLRRMTSADISGFPVARRVAHETEKRQLAQEIFGSDA